MALSSREQMRLQQSIREILRGEDRRDLQWRIAEMIQDNYDISVRPEDTPEHHITAGEGLGSVADGMVKSVGSLYEWVCGRTGEER